MESGNWKAEALLGAVVIGVVSVFVWLTFSLGGGAAPNSNAYVLMFDSALGLSVDNAVAVAGVKVGVVNGIAVDGRRARVAVLIDPDVVVFADARAAVRGKTLLGEKYVDLYLGDTGLAALAPGSTLENNEPTVDFDQVIRDVSLLVHRLNNIAPTLESAVARIDDAMKDQDGRAIANELVGTLQDVRALVRDTNQVVKSSGDDVRLVLGVARDKGPSLIEKLESASSRVDVLLAAVDPKIIEAAVQRMGPAVQNIDGVTGDVKLAMGDVREAARRLDGVLLRVDTALKRLDAVNESAVREFLQVQGVRVNFIPDASVTTRIKKLQEDSAPLPD